MAKATNVPLAEWKLLPAYNHMEIMLCQQAIEKDAIKKKISRLHPDRMEALSKQVISGLLPK